MELFGILFSIPAAFMVSTVYCLLLEKFILNKNRLSNIFIAISIMVLFLFLTELCFVIGRGPISIQNSIGSIYYILHSFLFFLVIPSMANVLMLQRIFTKFAKWYFIAPICSFVALIAVLLQYHVSETLYGIQ